MKATSKGPEETRYYTLAVNIEDAPLEPIPERQFSHKGKSFQVRDAYARWSHGDQPSAVRVQGAVTKSDGTLGKVRVSITYRLGEPGWRGDTTPEAPAWLAELIKEHA